MNIPENIQTALGYSRNFATAKPNIGLTEKEHILGLANLLEKTALELSAALPQPSAHLTIPGALEWDGDNGTHGADGESHVHGESAAAIATLKALGYTHNGGTHWKPPVGQKPDFDLIDSLRAQLDNTEQSRRSFFDLSQDLEKRLVERDAVLNQAYMALIGYLPVHRNDLTDAAIAACSAILFPVEAKAACSRCGGWGHIETEDSAHDCPECGPSVIERAVEAGVMNAPAAAVVTDDRPAGCCCPPKGHAGIWAAAMCPVHMGLRRLASKAVNREQFKPKTCIECDQPYCHGVCVERGDQDYDRDQATKGGDDE